MADLTIVIPVRKGGDAGITLDSLDQQTYRNFDIIVIHDLEQRGSNWARNSGLCQVDTPFVLCSDDDIQWKPDALQILRDCLLSQPQASYSYGSYFTPGIGEQCNVEFDAKRLRRHNYISTMSLVRTADHPGFDETIQRAQDWDLWLTMLAQGKIGVYCGRCVFTTTVRLGITFGNALTWEMAKRIVQAKHHANLG